MLEPVVQETGPNAPKASAAPAPVSSRRTARDAAVPVDSVTLKNTAVESPPSAQQMFTNRMERLATTTRPTASLESVKPMTTNASTTLARVSDQT